MVVVCALAHDIKVTIEYATVNLVRFTYMSGLHNNATSYSWTTNSKQYDKH